MTTRDRFTAAVASTIAVWGIAVAPAGARPADPAVVLKWNQVMQETVPAAVGPLQFRHFAIMNIAMFDAANSIENSYRPFHVRVAASQGASIEAAAAQAAHDVVVSLIPGDATKAVYDATLAAQLASIPPGLRAQGVAVGKAVAAHVLQWRATDGASAPPVPYELPLIAGLWQPTTPGAPAGLTQLPKMTPFAIVSTTQFLPPRFPELTSERYARDFNEVKDIGRKLGNTVRTAYQTQTAELFAGVITSTNIITMWNNVARDATLSEGLSLIAAARLFALMNASATDGLLTSQTSKFVYGLWRPQTAIQKAGDDLNDSTVADETWTSLLATPPYPSYAGNMACVGAASATALAHVVGPDVAVSVTWRGLPPNTLDAVATRSYGSFWDLALEEGDSRVYGGIHFRFDNEVSQVACAKVADYVFENRMQPLRH